MFPPRLLFLAALASLWPASARAATASPGADHPVILSREGRTTHNFRVRVDGRGEPVHNTAQGYFCQFEMTQPVAVTISCDQEIRQVEVRPLSRNIKATIAGREITFRLAAPAKLSVEINGDLAEPLYLFADDSERRTVNPDDPRVKYYRGGSVYQAGEIVLTDDQTVYIERGAIVEGRIVAKDASRIRILGRGILDATDHGSATTLINCRDVEIAGITVVKGGRSWVNRIFLCQNVRIRNYKGISWGPYSDGIDILGSKEVVIDDVFIRNEDDSIVLKTGKFGYQGDVENVVVKNSVIWHGHAGNALEIGYETMGNHIRNVKYQNIDIVRSDTQERKFRRAALSIHAAGNARISDIHYEDIRVEAAMEHLIHFELVTDITKWGSGGGTISGLHLKNVALTGGPAAISIIKGLEAAPIRNVVFENLVYHGKRIGSAADAAAHGFRVERAEVVWK